MNKWGKVNYIVTFRYKSKVIEIYVDAFSIEDAEEVLGGKPVIRKVGRGHIKGEDVYAA